MIQFSRSAKDYFFDRKKVLDMVDQKEGIAMNRIGGRIRLTAMRSMRPQRKPKKGPLVRKASAPGKPPRRHTDLGKGLSNIWYAYEPQRHRVVIAPVKFNWSAFPEMTVPELHEQGGTVTLVEANYEFNTSQGRKSRWIQVGRRGEANAKKRGKEVRRRKVKYPARPFMLPALEKNKQYILDSWSTSGVGAG
jgi:hypothetical protein